MGCCPQHFRQLLLSLHPDWLRGILSCGLSTSGCLCSISMDKDSDDSPEARRDVLEFLGPFWRLPWSVVYWSLMFPFFYTSISFSLSPESSGDCCRWCGMLLLVCCSCIELVMITGVVELWQQSVMAVRGAKSPKGFYLDSFVVKWLYLMVVVSCQ
jgi:hypothetical protein